MGTGRYGSKHTSALPKGVNSRTPQQNLRVRARSTGYELKMADSTARKYRDSFNAYLDELEKFQNAMKLTPDMVNAAGGTISVKSLDYYTLGNTNSDGEINLNSKRMSPTDKSMLDTLPHEHTHNLVHTLITKELGFAKGSVEYHKAYYDAAIEHSINQAALENYKRYMSNYYDKQIKGFKDTLKNSDNDTIKEMSRQFIRDTRKQKAELNTITIEQASKNSGMRDYALRQYPWAPSGHYIEMPTVAAENFVSSGHSYRKLLQDSPYSYFVLQNLYSRLHKKKK